MKQIILTATLFLLMLNIFGQKDLTKFQGSKWSVGTILMNEPNNYFFNSFKPNVFPGIIFRRNFKHYSVRIGIEYTKEFYRSGHKTIFTDGYKNEGMLRIGIEKGIVFKKYFRPYLALDFTGIKSYSNLIYDGWLLVDTVLPNNYYHGDTLYTHIIGYGLTPTLGIEFILTKNISLAIETRMFFFHSKIVNLETDTKKYKYQLISDVRINNRIGALTLNINF